MWIHVFLDEAEDGLKIVHGGRVDGVLSKRE
jgi:hypothetical protein